MVARWTTVDLLAELHPDINPYNYVLNNPVNFIDQFGLDTIKPNNPVPNVVNPGDVVQADGKNYTVNTAGGTITGKKQSKSEDNSDDDNTINWGPNANRRVVSSYTLRKINEIMDASNNHNIFITSTQRTPRGQARAMYHNILTHGVAFSYRLYGRYGDMVTRVAEEGIANGESDDEIVNDMTDEIISLGPQNVSRHTGDPNVVNVLDIAPNTINNKRGFIQESRNQGVFILTPPTDPAFHLEIKQ